MSNTCMRYSKRAVAPIVSLVTLLFNNVLWLGSRAKSPPGKGTQQETLFYLYTLPIIFCFSFSVFCGGSAQSEIISDLEEDSDRLWAHLSIAADLKSPLPVHFWLSRLLVITLNVSGWVMVYFYFTCSLNTFPLFKLFVAFWRFSLWWDFSVFRVTFPSSYHQFICVLFSVSSHASTVHFD